MKLPEPTIPTSKLLPQASWVHGNLYTEAQMRQAIRDAFEEAARVCENPDILMNSTFQGVADAIRKLKETI